MRNTHLDPNIAVLNAGRRSFVMGRFADLPEGAEQEVETTSPDLKPLLDSLSPDADEIGDLRAIFFQDGYSGGSFTDDLLSKFDRHEAFFVVIDTQADDADALAIERGSAQAARTASLENDGQFDDLSDEERYTYVVKEAWKGLDEALKRKIENIGFPEIALNLMAFLVPFTGWARILWILYNLGVWNAVSIAWHLWQVRKRTKEATGFEGLDVAAHHLREAIMLAGESFFGRILKGPGKVSSKRAGPSADS